MNKVFPTSAGSAWWAFKVALHSTCVLLLLHERLRHARQSVSGGEFWQSAWLNDSESARDEASFLSSLSRRSSPSLGVSFIPFSPRRFSCRYITPGRLIHLLDLISFIQLTDFLFVPESQKWWRRSSGVSVMAEKPASVCVSLLRQRRPGEWDRQRERETGRQRELSF